MSADGDIPMRAGPRVRPVAGAARDVSGVLGALAPRLLFGLRLASSVSLALFTTYYLELPNPFWAATTAAIVCQPNLGAALQKGRFRAWGTTLGALALVSMLAVFPQERVGLIVCLALWCGLCGGAVVLLRNSAAYAAGLSGITAAILFADTVADPSSAFFLSLTRVSEICIGIGATAIVMLLTEPGTAKLALASLMERIALNLRAGFLDTLQNPRETKAMEAARRTVVKTLAPLNAAIDAATGESALLYSRRGNLHGAVTRLVTALVGWRAVSRRKALAAGDVLGQASGFESALAMCLARINPAAPERRASAARVAALQAMADLEAMTEPEALADPEARAHLALKPEGQGAVDARLRLNATRSVAACLLDLMDAVIFLRTAEGERKPMPAQPLVIADALPALVAGLRAVLSVLAVSAFWILTAWPNGALAVAFAVISTLIFVAFADEARARATDYALGVAVMAILGSGIYFLVLPALSTFPALVGLLFLLYVPLGMMQVGSWHSPLFLAMSICALPLLGIGNPIAYDPAGYFNVAFAILAGTAAGTVFFVIVPPMAPAQRTRRLIRLSVRDLRRLIGTRREADPRRWQALLTRRLESLPAEASLDQSGALLALLAMGLAVLQLRGAPAGRAQGEALEAALAALANGRLSAALEQLGAVRRRIAAEGAGTERQAHVAVLTDAIMTHAALLGALDPAPARSARP